MEVQSAFKIFLLMEGASLLLFGLLRLLCVTTFMLIGITFSGSIQALLSAPNPDDPLSENIAKHWKTNEAEAVETGILDVFDFKWQWWRFDLAT